MIKKNSLLFILGTLFSLSMATPAFAIVGASAMVELYVQIVTISKTWGTVVAKYTLILLWTTSVIAFAIGCKDLALGGGLQLEGIIALFVRFAFLTGMMSWLLSDPARLLMIPNSLETLGGKISGTPINFGTISSSFYGMMSPILDYYRELSWFTDPGLSIVCCVLVFLIHCLAVLFITTILLVKIETIFIIVGGMFTAAFFVIGQFRDIFMGYIKALVMNGLKLLLLSLCVGMIVKIMETWGAELQGALGDANGIYNVAMPMTFGLLAFYVVIKSVPQYAVAILTGHASADGGLGRAAVMAGYSAGNSFVKTSQALSQTTKTGLSAIANAGMAYLGKGIAQSNTDSKDGKGKSSSGGAWAALKAFATTDVKGGLHKSQATGENLTNSKGGNSNSGNEMQSGGAIDAKKAEAAYEQEKGGRK